MNKKDAERLKRSVEKAIAPYDAGTSMSHRQKAKERFYRRLNEQSHIFDKEAVFDRPDLIEQLAGTRKIHEWLKDPKFAQWWWDEHVITDELMALRHQSVGVLRDILCGEEVSASDALKAARMIFELTDQFPTKKQEVRFLDEELNKMDSGQVDREIKKLQGQLDALSSGDSDED